MGFPELNMFDYAKDTGRSQYEGVDLAIVRTVEAAYIKADDEDDRGNRYIEALPKRRSSTEMIEYVKEMPYSGFKVESQKPVAEKIPLLMKLKDLRYPLPMLDKLEDYMHTAMIKPLRQRYSTTLLVENKCNCTIGDENIVVDGLMIADERDGVDGSFSVIGYPGTGKSSAVKLLLDHYPRSIKHTSGAIQKVQIPYLFINCLGHSNFRELFNQMGRAVDRALSNFNSHFYENKVRKCRDLGAKTTEIINIIEMFNISVLVLDECQTINYSSNGDNSVENLVTIVNMTKVSVVCIGNQEAYRKMNANDRISRRLGIPLIVHDYCNDKLFFGSLVRWLFGYQWFCTDKRVVPDEKMIAALYKCTNGIIAHLFNMYTVMHEENFEHPEVAINASFVRQVSKKYYSHIEKLLKSQDRLDRDNAIHDAAMAGRERLIRMLEEVKTKEKQSAKDIVNGAAARERRTALLRNVFNNISKFGDYSYDSVARAFNIVVAEEENLDEAFVSRKVFEVLMKAQDSGSIIPVTKKDALDFVLDNE